MSKIISEAMPAGATLADWAKLPKDELIAHVMAADRARHEAAATHREMTEKLENTTAMLTTRSLELERTQKISAEMAATVAKQRDEIRDCDAEINAGRRNINELKNRLHASEMTVATLRGQLERVREADRLRLTAMGRQPGDPNGRNLTELLAAVGNQRDDVDWVTF
jgi:septal ring factor EnvC (AmiA/AmiB activator)